MNVLWVFAGGGLGSVLRYCIGLAFQKTSFALPLATLLANITACLVFAAVLRFGNTGAGSILKPLLLTGFCGGLSTFSSFGYETFLLLKQGQFFWAATNILLSTVMCIGAFYIFKSDGFK